MITGHEFSYTRDDGSSVVIRTPDFMSVSDLFEEFRCYLLACGYAPGSIDDYHKEAACTMSEPLD